MPYASMMTVEHLHYTEEQRKTLEAVLPQIVDYSKQKEAEWVTTETSMKSGTHTFSS